MLSLILAMLAAGATDALPPPKVVSPLTITAQPKTAPPADVAAQFATRSYRATRPAANVESRKAVDRHAPLVSLVVLNDDADGADLAGGIESCLAQSWPRTEVIVLDRTPGGGARPVAERHAGVLRYAQGGLPEALAHTTGELVGVTDSRVVLRAPGHSSSSSIFCCSLFMLPSHRSGWAALAA